MLNNLVKDGVRQLPKQLNILADENIVGLDVFFADLAPQVGNIQLRKIAGRAMCAEDLTHVHVLLVRSVTQVDAHFLAKAQNLLFVGSATIGVDHIDIDFLQKNNILFSYAPGCNAQGVCEYVLAAIALTAPQAFINKKNKHGIEIKKPKISLLGYGNTGSRIYKALDYLGVDVSVCDPFKQQDMGLSEVRFVSFESLLQADIISIHVPLTRDTKFATFGIFDRNAFAAMKKTAVFINTSRGDVVVEGDILQHAITCVDFKIVFDVWCNEPQINPTMLAHCALATPHIAGYSAKGKWRGSLQIYVEFCRAFNLQATKSAANFPIIENKILDNNNDFIWQLFALSYPLVRDNDALRAAFAASSSTHEYAVAFDNLRKNYPQRCEWDEIKIDFKSTALQRAWDDFLKYVL